jgi:hypothetical protein
MPRTAGLLLLLQFLRVEPSAGQTDATGPSPGSALGLAVAGTLVPVAVGGVMLAGADESEDRAGPVMLALGGLVLGPAVGYLYGGRTGHALAWSGIRTGLVLGSFMGAFGVCGWGCSAGDPAHDAAWLIMATGTGLAAAAAVYDLTRLKPSLEARRRSTVSLAPIYRAGPGLALRVSF